MGRPSSIAIRSLPWPLPRLPDQILRYLSPRAVSPSQVARRRVKIDLSYCQYVVCGPHSRPRPRIVSSPRSLFHILSTRHVTRRYRATGIHAPVSRGLSRGPRAPRLSRRRQRASGRGAGHRRAYCRGRRRLRSVHPVGGGSGSGSPPRSPRSLLGRLRAPRRSTDAEGPALGGGERESLFLSPPARCPSGGRELCHPRPGPRIVLAGPLRRVQGGPCGVVGILSRSCSPLRSRHLPGDRDRRRAPRDLGRTIARPMPVPGRAPPSSALRPRRGSMPW